MVDYWGLTLNLIAVIVGGLITFWAVYWAENRKEKKEDELKIYAPLYDELEFVYTKIASLSDWQLEKEWTRIESDHIQYRIHPQSLQRRLSKLYNVEFRNFFNTSRSSLILELSKYLNEELKTDYNSGAATSRYSFLSLYLVSGDDEYSLYLANNSFTALKAGHNIKYTTLEELDKDMRPKVQSMEIVKSVLKEQKRLMQEIMELRAEIGKKLKIQIEKSKLI